MSCIGQRKDMLILSASVANSISPEVKWDSRQLHRLLNSYWIWLKVHFIETAR